MLPRLGYPGRYPAWAKMDDKQDNPYTAPLVPSKPAPHRRKIVVKTKYSFVTVGVVLLTTYMFCLLCFLFFFADSGMLNGKWTLNHWRDALIALAIAIILFSCSVMLVRRDRRKCKYP